ncbi:Response regulator receiver domain-containing protein [Trichlorobacter thiogenes]|uniref:Response regulator receiver domain-containing protein n=1 Tax=Trichlorobacter thiogenes TaxID=115783 RepID=A0A1T4SAW4_9BACT|nr:response regulator [Trichlorobacter thiogenes]SKA25363.1 Response regulator receiver domain-containing protein [Trichlorobacter thiogenes]
MSTRLKILIIDDEENMRHMLSVMLHKYGYSAELAEDGGAALKLLSEHSYNFIICDIIMPGMDGLSFLRQAVVSGVTTPIIMMAAYGTKEIADRCMKEGAVDFICKPFKHHDLINKLLKISGAE